MPLCGITWIAGAAGVLGLGMIGVGVSSAIIDVSNSTHAVTLENLLAANLVGWLQAVNSSGNL